MIDREDDFVKQEISIAWLASRRKRRNRLHEAGDPRSDVGSRDDERRPGLHPHADGARHHRRAPVL